MSRFTIVLALFLSAAALAGDTDKLPDTRESVTHKFSVCGHEGYITVGQYESGQPGEIFITLGKAGSTLSGFADAFATAISFALQHGVESFFQLWRCCHHRQAVLVSWHDAESLHHVFHRNRIGVVKDRFVDLQQALVQLASGLEITVPDCPAHIRKYARSKIADGVHKTAGANGHHGK